MPNFQLLRKPWKDTGEIKAASALSAVKVEGGEQKVSPLSAARYGEKYTHSLLKSVEEGKSKRKKEYK